MKMLEKIISKILKQILEFVGSLKFLNPAGAPTPVFVGGPGDIGVQLNNLMTNLGLSEDFAPAGDPETLEPESPKPIFLSSKHFIEPNG